MEGLAAFLGAIMFMSTIFYSMLIGILIIYLIRYDLKSPNRKLLHSLPIMLASLIFAGIIFTYGFINPGQWNIYFNIMESIFFLVFLFYFVKTLILFPNIKHAESIKINLVLIILANMALAVVSYLSEKPVSLINVIQIAFLLAGFILFYIFIVSFLIFLEDKSDAKILFFKWKKIRRKEWRLNMLFCFLGYSPF